MEDLDQKIATLDSKLDAMKAGSKDPVGLSYKGRNSFYQPLDILRGRLKGSCFRCGHYKQICLKLGACKNSKGLRLKRGLRNNQLHVVGQMVLQRLEGISLRGALIKKGKSE